MISNFNNINLTIDLPALQKGMIRGEKIQGPFRERVTGEKYFRQALQVYNKEGKLVDSGFVQINDYTNMCQMVRVCNKSKKSFHLFERWEHYGSNFYKTTEFSVTDLVTGNIVGTVIDSYVEDLIKNLNTVLGECYCFVGDLEKDEYSKVLLECLNEFSKSNAPQLPFGTSKIFDEEMKETCECNLFEKLDIEDLFRNGEIDEDRRDILLNNLNCYCQNKPIEPELTEEQQEKIIQLRLKAQAEIAEVFAKKEK